jgi:hypothetical protein
MDTEVAPAGARLELLAIRKSRQLPVPAAAAVSGSPENGMLPTIPLGVDVQGLLTCLKPAGKRNVATARRIVVPVNFSVGIFCLEVVVVGSDDVDTDVTVGEEPCRVGADALRLCRGGDGVPLPTLTMIALTPTAAAIIAPARRCLDRRR